MNLLHTVCALWLIASACAQKWHSTHNYPNHPVPSTPSPTTVTERQRREMPADGLFHDLYKRSAEKEGEGEAAELSEAGEGVEIPEDNDTGTESQVEKRQAPGPSEDAEKTESRRLARQVENSKEEIRPFRKRRDTVSSLHGKHGRKRRQADTSDEESKTRNKREEAEEQTSTTTVTTPPVSPIASAFDARLRRQADCEETADASLKEETAERKERQAEPESGKGEETGGEEKEAEEVASTSDSENVSDRRRREAEAEEATEGSDSLAKGEPEQPIESANDAESASRVRRVSRGGNSHRNRPSTVNRMSKTNGNNADTQQQAPDEIDA